jgi:hypothetical protein
MLRMIVLGNLMTTGGIYLLGVTAFVLRRISFYITSEKSLPSIEFVAKSIRIVGDELIGLILKYPGLLFVLFALSGLASMIWYVIARRIETREMKKRWLIIQKSSVSEEQ